jgi:prepilin signal peptidase PulO-like enzyme (type II secretory pathway)
MEFQLIRLFLFYFVLYIAAVFDLKTRKVPDFLTCCLWFIVMASLDGKVFPALALSFATIWLLNITFLNWKGREFWGWGDILIFPPFFAQCYAWGQPILATLALIAPFFIGALRNKEEEAIVPYLLVGAVIAELLTAF